MDMRHKTFALLMCVMMLTITPLSISAATRPAGPRWQGFALGALAPAQTGGVSVPVAGTSSKGGKFTGAFNIKEFRVAGDRVVAVGTLTGTIVNGTGNVIGTVLRTIQMLVTIPSATCDILHLELGPLDLDLLGLQVHLDRIVLDIDADPTGGLLGALLCAVANLLNAGGPLADLVGLLNQILGLL
jgi:hypothetical protein